MDGCVMAKAADACRVNRTLPKESYKEDTLSFQFSTLIVCSGWQCLTQIEGLCGNDVCRLMLKESAKASRKTASEYSVIPTTFLLAPFAGSCEFIFRLIS
jgi:hypothetical protein